MTNLYRPYNPNPKLNRAGDCTVRAICKATDQSWIRAYIYLCVYGLMEFDMPTTNHVWGKYLKSRGFHRHLIDDDCTVEDFCRDHPTGTYILAIDGHVVCVVDGFYYDSWDSGQEIPVYYWTRRSE